MKQWIAILSLGVCGLLQAASPVRAPAENLPGVSNEPLAKSLYMLHCQGCHLPDGSGFPDRIPNMKDFVGNFLNVEGGKAYLVQVPGSATSPMKDSELALVLNWILARFSAEQLPENYQPYTAEEVTKYRSINEPDVILRRAELLKQLKANKAQTQS